MRPAQFSVQTGHIFQQSPQRVFDHWQQSLLQGRWLFATPQGRMQGGLLSRQSKQPFCGAVWPGYATRPMAERAASSPVVLQFYAARTL